jgi:hypothetical protein
MGLLSQTTDLKSLRYGKDRFDGGSSGQPFVKFRTPDGEALPVEKFGREDLIGQTGGVDQLIRGGSLIPERIVYDTERIVKFLTTQQGLTFLAKQEGLYLSQNIQLYGNDNKNWPTLYNPASLLQNVIGSAANEHFPNITYNPNYKLGKKPSERLARENLYNQGNTYQKNSVRKTASPKVLVDAINYQPLFADSNPLKIQGGANAVLQDTVPFYITKISNDGDSTKNVHIHFRSFVSGLTDNFKAEWGSHKYMGRGENFYYYNGFSRDISFKFIVPVLSKYEQQSVYSKLNYLASLMAPDYVTTGGANQGFMRGNLVRITLGDYLINVPGIIQCITYTQNDEAGWDIARNSDGVLTRSGSADFNATDTGGWIMPKMIEVSGFSFTPIHDFIPKTVNPEFVNTGNGTYVDAPFINFGKNPLQPQTAGGYGYRNLGTQ